MYIKLGAGSLFGTFIHQLTFRIWTINMIPAFVRSNVEFFFLHFFQILIFPPIISYRPFLYLKNRQKISSRKKSWNLSKPKTSWTAIVAMSYDMFSKHSFMIVSLMFAKWKGGNRVENSLRNQFHSIFSAYFYLTPPYIKFHAIFFVQIFKYNLCLHRDRKCNQ